MIISAISLAFLHTFFKYKYLNDMWRAFKKGETHSSVEKIHISHHGTLKVKPFFILFLSYACRVVLAAIFISTAYRQCIMFQKGDRYRERVCERERVR